MTLCVVIQFKRVSYSQLSCSFSTVSFRLYWLDFIVVTKKNCEFRERERERERNERGREVILFEFY